MLLPLPRDKDTPGQEFFFVSGQRDISKGLDVPLQWDIPSLGNAINFIVLGMYKFDVEHDSSSERSQIKIRRTDVVSTLVKY